MGVCLKASVFVVALLAVGIAILQRFAKAPLPEIPVDLTGKVALVTGASAGCGKETARILARWNATVIMAVRNTTKGAAVLRDIQETTGSNRLELWELDLAEFRSINAFTKKFLESGLPLHLLINNAGLLATTRQLTKDGLELTFQSNHLGHFVLTNSLLTRLKESAPSRVVHVSSHAHYHGVLDVDDLQGEKGYLMGGMRQYGNTKLMNVLYSNELNRRLQGTGVVSNSLHPGFVRTEFGRDAGTLFDLFKFTAGNLFARDEYQGALTTIHVATDPSLEKVGGEYFSSCRLKAPSALARNETAARLLWEASDKLAPAPIPAPTPSS